MQNVTAMSKASTGRVIAAGPNDRIFVFYSDHGAPGILGMPSGDFLYADQLHKTIKHRAKRGGFKEMVLYIEACESGSMFEGLLEENINVYATTAANGEESSWGTYCPGFDPPPPPEFNTCLGDLYSVSWMEDSDMNDLTHESLKKQFQRVRQRTSQNYTFVQGSHVERYGQRDIDEEPVANYLGALNTGRPQSPSANDQPLFSPPLLGAVPQREADLIPLAVKALHGQGTPEGQAAAAKLSTEHARRASIDRSVLLAATLLSERSNTLGLVTAAAALSNRRNVVSFGEVLVADSFPAPGGSGALVDDWDCLRGMVTAWQGACGSLDQYSMRHTRAFANFCNLGVHPNALGVVASEVCPSTASV